MKNIIRDTNETKDVAAFIAAIGLIEGSDKSQLYYDMQCTKPVPKEEALIYIASGKACAAITEEDNEVITFGNIGGKFIVELDDSCPNGYCILEVEPSAGQSLTCLGEEYFIMYDAEAVHNGSTTNISESIFDFIKYGTVFDNTSDFSGYYITVKVNSGSEDFAIVANLMFSSACRLAVNDDKSYGFMSFVGNFDGGERAADHLILRYSFGISEEGDETSVELIFPN